MLSSLNKNNKDIFDKVVESLHSMTISNHIKWIYVKNHVFDSETNKYFDASFEDMQFQFEITKTASGNWHFRSFIIKSPIFGKEGGLLSCDINPHLFSIKQYILDNIDFEGESNQKLALDSILSKIGKDVIREDRLSKLLDKDKGHERPVIKAEYIDGGDQIIEGELSLFKKILSKIKFW